MYVYMKSSVFILPNYCVIDLIINTSQFFPSVLHKITHNDIVFSFLFIKNYKLKHLLYKNIHTLFCGSEVLLCQTRLDGHSLELHLFVQGPMFHATCQDINQDMKFKDLAVDLHDNNLIRTRV